MRRFFVERVENDLNKQVEAGLDWAGWDSIVEKDSRVFIKPNFTFPFFKPGVTTSPEVLDAVVSVLARKTRNITIGESDGAANSWKAEDAFEGHGLGAICGAHGIRTMNLTKAARETVEIAVGRWRKARVELPRVLLRETDVFITIPVPKIHCLTKVSLGLKNQWGCIPWSEKRFTFHPHFDEMIWRLNRLLNPRIIVGDCTWMLTGNGPMFGEQIKTGMITASNDIGSFELGMLHLMGLESWRISHIRAAQRNGVVPAALDGIEFNADWRRYRSDRFFLKRTLQNYIALAGFRSRLVTWVGYESFLARPLHYILYAVKGGNPLAKAVRERRGAQG